MALPTVIVIAGPTASGKTALAVSVARLLGTVIISADARQCYREMNIGVAKPSLEQLAAVQHYFIDSHSIADNVNAAVFETLSLSWADKIFSRHETLVLAGGSGLYINAFCDGLDPLPAPDPVIRENIRKQYALHGISWLQEQITLFDARFALEGEMKNPHRLQRALEVVQQTGQSIFSFHRKNVAGRNFNTLHFALSVPKEELNARIDDRVEQMMAKGLLNEVEGLYAFRNLPALQTVGYQEFFPVLSDRDGIEQATTLVKIHTRQYAKRQLTWFRRDQRYHWLQENPLEEIMSRLGEVRSR